MSSIQKLFLNFGQFFGTGTLLLLLSFVTFPILTRLLTREEYGILGLVTNTIAIAVAIAKGGLSDSIIRFYREYTDSPERLTLFTSTVLTRGVLLTTIVVGVYVFTLPIINEFIGVDEGFLGCFLIMAVYLFARPLNIIVMNYMRALGKIFLLNVFNATTKIVEVVLAFTLLLWLVGELYGYFLGVALAQLGATVFFYRWLLRNHDFSITQVSGTLTLDLLKFGFPLLLTELAYLLLSYTDRYMIVAYHGQAVLGVYTVGYNVPSYVNDLLMFSLSYAVVPIYTELYVREGKEATETFLSRSLNYYAMTVIPLCVGYAAVSRDALTTLASPKYSESADFSPLILVGLVFLGMNSILSAGLYLQKKSGQMLTIMLSAVAINIGANMLLLPRYGATGAAVATMVACVASSALTVVLSRRYLRANVPYLTIAYYSAASALMYFIITGIDTGQAWLNLAARIPLGMAIMAAATIAREDEIRAYAWRFIRNVSGKTP
jgi:O-antigen/teichoic acid export membrane protein